MLFGLHRRDVRSAEGQRGFSVAVTLLAVTGAVMAKVTLLREWQGAADRYRWLATSQVSENLTPRTDGRPMPA